MTESISEKEVVSSLEHQGAPLHGNGQASKPHTILLVDDEVNVLNALQRALRPDGYRILTATSGTDALAILTHETVAAIISDQRMARLSGTEFLRQARLCQPDAVRIMLTAYADTEAIMDAINQSEVYRFITKPWDDGDLRLTLRRALDQFDLVMENRALMAQVQAQNAELAFMNQDLERRVAERTAEVQAQRDTLKTLYDRLDSYFMDTIRILAGLLELRDAYVGSHSKRVAAAARYVAERFGLQPHEVREIEIAATLHDIGKIGIPDMLLTKPEPQLTEAQKEAVQKHPQIGQALLMGIEELQPVARIIRHHHERFDGKGYPDQLSGQAIPLGARIIAVANAYDRAVYVRGGTARRNDPATVNALITRAGSDFDPQVVPHFIDYVITQLRQHWARPEVKVEVRSLQPGMILSRDLYSARGILLMASDSPLRLSHIERIRKFNSLEQIGPIYVYHEGEYRPT